jgi:hypothetical protein
MHSSFEIKSCERFLIFLDFIKIFASGVKIFIKICSFLVFAFFEVLVVVAFVVVVAFGEIINLQKLANPTLDQIHRVRLRDSAGVYDSFFSCGASVRRPDTWVNNDSQQKKVAAHAIRLSALYHRDLMNIQKLFNQS